MINLGRTYRTREGNRVRALNAHRLRKKVLINGELRDTGTTHVVIVGQVYMMDDLSDCVTWCTRVWDEFGKDLAGKSECDLVEYIEPKIQQPQLF